LLSLKGRGQLEGAEAAVDAAGDVPVVVTSVSDNCVDCDHAADEVLISRIVDRQEAIVAARKGLNNHG